MNWREVSSDSLHIAGTWNCKRPWKYMGDKDKDKDKAKVKYGKFVVGCLAVRRT